MARTTGFFKPFCLISFPRSLIQRFDLSGRGVFLLSYSRYLAKTHVRTSSTLVLILRFDKTSILFLFFVVFFLFVLTFFEDIISKVVAARQMYTTIEGIKPSSGSVLIFFKWAAFGYINNEPIIFICSYKLKVSLVILITLS